jgi:hypothetical protein
MNLVNHVTLAETSKEPKYISPVQPRYVVPLQAIVLYYVSNSAVRKPKKKGQKKHLHERKAKKKRRNMYIQVDGPLSVCVVGIITKTKTKTEGEKGVK